MHALRLEKLLQETRLWKRRFLHSVDIVVVVREESVSHGPVRRRTSRWSRKTRPLADRG